MHPIRPAGPVLRVRPLPGSPTRGRLAGAGLDLPCILGRSGITRMKREGDGATPVARMRLREVLYRADRVRRPRSPFPTRAISSADGWCDDIADGRYNRPVSLPFAGSHERMTRTDRLYDIVVVLDWNLTRRAIGRGSAIFFHLTHPEGKPTAGCVAVAPDHMRRLLARLTRGAVLVVG